MLNVASINLHIAFFPVLFRYANTSLIDALEKIKWLFDMLKHDKLGIGWLGQRANQNKRRLCLSVVNWRRRNDCKCKSQNVWTIQRSDERKENNTHDGANSAIKRNRRTRVRDKRKKGLEAMRRVINSNWSSGESRGNDPSWRPRRWWKGQRSNRSRQCRETNLSYSLGQFTGR